MTKIKFKNPLPIFDNLTHFEEKHLTISSFFSNDFSYVRNFLKQYDGNESTYINYRRETERFLHWSWIVANKSALKLKREDIENYIKFCQNPPKSWIGLKTVSRFINKDGHRVPNPQWRPFVAKISKAEVNGGKKPSKDNYTLSQQSVKAIFVILGSFYTYLINENLTEINPVLQIRQKSKFLLKHQNARKIPRLSENQWKCLIETTKKLADEIPHRHQRTLFIITAMYLMYLRISEFIASKRWVPLMGHFHQDSNQNWWFITVGKGNKERFVTVSDGMIIALKNWRTHLELSPLPSPNEQYPLIPKIKGHGAVTSIRMIRQLIQECFDATIKELTKNGKKQEATMLANATVHWLRHTGISDDINKYNRPINHVRDDAGHASIATTDRYNDVLLRERHSSGKNKQVK